ncbi:DUF58 domain-containing protein (plasmid) [Haladaptatus sp. SPP-AMP-3]|uniref:DUF7269 family protein n=1 Tax=Haladaptatus sp. SPP-AMP-3 TaxID=3121295 RepID=UPI003C308499
MSRLQRPALVLGVASSLVGVLLVASPGVGRAFDPTGVLRTAPLALLGSMTILAAAGYALAGTDARRDTEDSHGTKPHDFPRPENRPRYDHPGTAFARRVAEIRWADRREDDPSDRRAFRAEIRELAVTVLSQTETRPRDEIETRLDDGSWTDDSAAAAFFADDVVPPLSVRQRLRSLRGSEPPFARRARHAVADLAGRLDDADVSPELSDATERTLDDAPVVTTSELRSSDSNGRTGDSTVARTGRTRGVTAAALVAGGLGIVTLRPGLLLLALFGITVAGTARLGAPPSATVDIDRAVSDTDPDPGEEVTVTLSVRNTEDTTLTDLRLIDGVPAGLRVTDGSPRFATALRPGKEATFTYSVEAASGRHEFDPALLIVRDTTGVYARRTFVSDAKTELSCRETETLDADVPLRTRPTIHAGRGRSTIDGSGVEFHSVREYRPGDPRSRIDWKRTAKTGEFTTVNFRESRLERVMVVVDARAEAYPSPSGGDRPSVRWCVTAARRVTDRVTADSTPVGLTALSPTPCWLPPSAGESHRTRIRDALAEDPAFGWTVPDDEFDVSAAVAEFHRLASQGTQVVLLSPVCDDGAKRAARRLDAYGYPVTVISPDPTAPSSAPPDAAHGYASLSRGTRLSDLRSAGIPVLDWDPTDPLEEVLYRDS